MRNLRTALVCSGGGARGAYEAGVIRYLREEMPADLRPHINFDILCGTSVGAITCSFLAATMEQPDQQGRILEDIWSTLELEKVYRVDGEDLWSISRKMWRLARQDDHPGWRLYDFLHLAPLEELVRTRAPWPRISANLAKGLFEAISVSTTRIADGKTIVYVQRREGGVPAWSRDPFTEAREAVLSPEHVLASAAIPLLFRAVKIGEEYFCDGSVRQNTPLSPALRLGAERVLILSLRHRPNQLPPVPKNESYPSTATLMGRVMNAMMLDHTDYDLDRLRRFNAIFEAGRLTFGPDFITKMNETVSLMRGQPYRTVKDLVVRPSRDLGEIAAQHAKGRKLAAAASDSFPTRMLHRITQSHLFTQADLASYLLFDGGYAKALISLAMEDCHAMREQLCEFFAPTTDAAPESATPVRR